MRTVHDGSTYELVFKHLYKKPLYNTDGTISYYLTREDPPLGTECTIKADGFEISTGVAWCHEADQFNKGMGRKVALTKAVKDFSQPLRTALWECYLDRKPDMVLEADKIIQEQGWSDETVLDLAFSFLNEKGLAGKFAGWLMDIVKEENKRLDNEDSHGICE